MATPDAGPLRMMLTLGIAGLLSGSVLAGVYLATAPRIERNRAEALERAIYDVVPGATSRRAYEFRDGKLEEYEGEEGSLPKGEAVFAAYDQNGEPLAWAIPAEGAGFQDVVGLIYGYDPQKRIIVGMKVLRSLETPGLGDKIIKDADFVNNFSELAVDPQILVTKKGRSAPNEVDAISGATISSKAVVRIINEAHTRWQDLLPPLETDAAGEAP